MTLTFDLLTLKVVSRVTWAISVPIFVFLGRSVLDLGPMYATDVRQTDVRQKHRLMPPPIRVGHNNARLKTWVEKPFCQAMIIKQKYKKRSDTMRIREC